MNAEDFLLYGGLAVALLLLAFTAYSVVAAPAQPSSGAVLQGNAQNFQAYEALRRQSASSGEGECGNLTDLRNIQHLSHHDYLQPCLDKVDPELRKQAIGR